MKESERFIDILSSFIDLRRMSSNSRSFLFQKNKIKTAHTASIENPNSWMEKAGNVKETNYRIAKIGMGRSRARDSPKRKFPQRKWIVSDPNFSPKKRSVRIVQLLPSLSLLNDGVCSCNVLGCFCSRSRSSSYELFFSTRQLSSILLWVKFKSAFNFTLNVNGSSSSSVEAFGFFCRLHAHITLMRHRRDSEIVDNDACCFVKDMWKAFFIFLPALKNAFLLAWNKK